MDARSNAKSADILDLALTCFDSKMFKMVQRYERKRMHEYLTHAIGYVIVIPVCLAFRGTVCFVNYCENAHQRSKDQNSSTLENKISKSRY